MKGVLSCVMLNVERFSFSFLATIHHEIITGTVYLTVPPVPGVYELPKCDFKQGAIVAIFS